MGGRDAKGDRGRRNPDAGKRKPVKPVKSRIRAKLGLPPSIRPSQMAHAPGYSSGLDLEQAAARPDSPFVYRNNQGRFVNSDGFNTQQSLFVHRWLIHHNATRAYLEAGYTATGQAVGINANRLLHSEKIQAVVDRETAIAAAKFAPTRDNLIRQIARVAFSDARQLLNDDGTAKPISEIDDDTAAIIGGMEVREVYNADGVAVGRVCKYRHVDPTKGQDMLAKHLGVYTDGGQGRKDRLRELVDSLKRAVDEDGSDSQ